MAIIVGHTDHFTFLAVPNYDWLCSIENYYHYFCIVIRLLHCVKLNIKIIIQYKIYCLHCSLSLFHVDGFLSNNVLIYIWWQFMIIRIHNIFCLTTAIFVFPDFKFF